MENEVETHGGGRQGRERVPEQGSEGGGGAAGGDAWMREGLRRMAGGSDAGMQVRAIE